MKRAARLSMLVAAGVFGALAARAAGIDGGVGAGQDPLFPNSGCVVAISQNRPGHGTPGSVAVFRNVCGVCQVATIRYAHCNAANEGERRIYPGQYLTVADKWDLYCDSARAC
jgi:hypothetical protein